MSSNSTSAKQKGNEVVHEAKRQASKPWVHVLERLGFLTRGAIYLIIGLLALKLAFGAGGATASPSSAIKLVGSQPYGEILLIIIALGLAGYSLWGFIRAILDPLGRGNDLNGLIDRAGFLFSGFSYAALLIPTVQSLLNKPSSQGSTAGLWAKLVSGPSGKWVMIGLGLFWLGAAIGQWAEAFTARFLRDLKVTSMSSDEIRTATLLGKTGYAARGVVFFLIGITVLKNFFAAGSTPPKGFSDALSALAHAPYGLVILAIVATGLILFGIYSMLCAKWNRVVNRSR